MNSLFIRSFAKINLGLLVKDKRPDGYHNIETIFVPIRLSDEIRLKKIKKNIIIKILNQKIKIPKGKTNLAFKAAKLFFDKSGILPGIEITIKKRIQVGAGLGGGSSDGAAVLQGLNKLYNKPLSNEELYGLALKIGMDVPFFLTGKSCYATGRGELLEPIKIPKLNIVLYCPEYPIITKWAYQQISKIKYQKSKISFKLKNKRLLTNAHLSFMILRNKLVKGDLSNLQRHIRNSFEDLVFAHYPDLARMKEFFRFNGAYAASLSGSGSAVFGLVEKKDISVLKTALKKNKIKAVFTESISR
jgi:4-diphosphocytidyl-2-C-methyl-D-erythritol kinase